MEEESIDHILIHCTKARVLWEFFFLVFLVWHGSFRSWLEISFLVGMVPSWARSIERCGWQPHYVFFGRFRRKDIIAFEDEEFSIQRRKNSFACNFWCWSKSVIDERLLPLIKFFFDWLGPR